MNEVPEFCARGSPSGNSSAICDCARAAGATIAMLRTIYFSALTAHARIDFFCDDSVVNIMIVLERLYRGLVKMAFTVKSDLDCHKTCSLGSGCVETGRLKYRYTDELLLLTISGCSQFASAMV